MDPGSVRTLTTHEGCIEVYYHFRGSKIQVDAIALQVQAVFCRFPLSEVFLNSQPAKYIKGFQAQLVHENLSLSAKVEGGKLQLVLKSLENFILPITYENDSYPFPASPLLKIKGLRVLIENQIKRSDFTIFNIEIGSSLRDGGTLEQSEITQDSLLFILLDDNPLERIHEENLDHSSLENAMGVASLTFVNFRDEMNVFFDCRAPQWRTVIPGLNLEGKCLNSKCTAFGNWVCDPLGVGAFSMHMVRAKAKCPVKDCGKKLEGVTSCIFWNCHYTITGLEVGKEKEEILNGNAPKDNALSFKKITENHQSNLTQWEYLTITTTAIPSAQGFLPDYCTLL